MALIEVKVPDIGDFTDVTVIELLVAVGDQIQKEQSLITVESDKASMEIPSEAAGTVKELKVKIGDKVSRGSLILMLEASQNEAASPVAAAAKNPAPAIAQQPVQAQVIAPQASSYSGSADIQCDTLVLGGGPGGYSAAFRAADLGLSTVIVERYATLGGVCLNVGCIPSKALLHLAAVADEAKELAEAGVSFAEPKVDIDKVRAHKEGVVKKLTSGLAAMAKMRKVTIMQGVGEFIDPHHLKVTQENGQTQTIYFKTSIIAAGSEAVKLPFLPEDPRIVTSTGALALRIAPKRMLVIGGGIIGLEMGTAYSSLFGTKLDVVEMLDGLMQGPDRDAVKVWEKYNGKRFENVMLKTKTIGAKVGKKGIDVTFEAQDGTQTTHTYDLVLQAVGRKPNGALIGADKAGVAVQDRGFIPVDIQMRTNVSHIFAIGDIVGQPMLAHKAVHEAHVAAEVIAGELLGDEKLAKTAFEASVIPSVAYTDPEVAWVGLTEAQAKEQGIAVEKGHFPWSASGRAIANTRDEGFTKLLFSKENGRILGGTIVGTGAGDMIGEIALAIEMGADAIDIGKTIHPHPTLGESIGMAAEAAEGHCTDLPPVKKR